MKLNEFISNVLQDIDRGLHEAKEKTDRKYFVESGQNRGVHFDIALLLIKSSHRTSVRHRCEIDRRVDSDYRFGPAPFPISAKSTTTERGPAL